MFFAGFLNLEDRVVIFSVMPLIRSELHLSDVFVGALMTVFLWTYAISSPLAGYIGDRLSRRRVIIGSLAAWSVVTIAAGLITSPAQLMTTRVLLAISEAFYIPASLAIVGDYHTAQTRAKAVAVLIIGMSLGPIVGGAGAGWLGEHYGWRPTLQVLGGVGVILAAVLAVFLRDVPVGASEGKNVVNPPDAGFAQTIGEILRKPTVFIVMLATGTSAFCLWMLLTWLPIFLYDNFKMSLTESGFWGNVSASGPLLIGALLGGWLSDFVGAKQPKRRLLLMIVFFSLALPFPILFGVANSSALVLASAFFFQMCRALGELNTHPLLFHMIAPARRSTAVGIGNFVNCVFGGAGALIVGHYRATIGFQAMFSLVPFMILLAVAGLLFAYFRTFDADVFHKAIPK